MRLLLAYADIRQHAPGREGASEHKEGRGDAAHNGGHRKQPWRCPKSESITASANSKCRSCGNDCENGACSLVRSSRQYGRKPVRLNVNKFKCCRTLQGHTGKIYALDWSYLESTWIVSASQDGRPIVWNAVSSQKSHAIRLACAWVMTTSFSPAGTAVACGGLDNVCLIFHLSSLPDKDGNLPVSCTLMGHKGYLTCCHYVPNHEAHILTSSRHQTCILWEAEANKCLHTFGGDSPSGHNGDIMSKAVGHENTCSGIAHFSRSRW
ncbi:hypothetical protein BDL97_01G095200 [Sphagnum fallax]|nr:hypothetical protein BDL97_01G095200 [Sphagnum fallax]KAH8974309.1 hypothetical protein BDL97_01G095200 [Sphagnum fallax]KAH8974310.1 hypothetical protein BDL97_01G095200 [Sphagnum fallax]KAH8974311.1 hypothetical protein BDL97_01G095200 [Sphagnum fallax]